jgi:hypothetical protein
MTVRRVHPLHSLRAKGTRQSRRVAPMATKRNGYPALRREAGAPAWGFTKGVCPLRGDRTRGLAPFVGVHEAGFRAEWATGPRRA